MPELPEVETIRRMVETYLIGHTVTEVDISLAKLLRQSVITAPAVLVGRELTGARRRGKVLDIGFSDELDVLIHFKLAGQLAIELPDGQRYVAGHPVPKFDGELPHKATHAKLTFDDGRIAWYSDIRQFGWLSILPSDDVPSVLDALAIGPEATEPIDITRLAGIFARRSVPVKVVLLDQGVLAGLGNIYVDEVLFASGIHPATPAKALAVADIDTIAGHIPHILAEGIRQGGATIIHGKAVPDDEFPAVHGREGEACFRCGTTIVKTRVGGRGTYTCPTCQPDPAQR